MCIKLLEKNIPTDKYVVRVRHFHKGNSSNKVRHGHPYYTKAKILLKGTDEVIGEGEAICSRQDLPSRQTGRNIAVGRAMLYIPANELHTETKPSIGDLH